MTSVSLPFLISSMTITTVPASQVAVSINEIMRNKKEEKEEAMCVGFTRNISYPEQNEGCFTSQ